jgi:hypothetical protein
VANSSQKITLTLLLFALWLFRRRQTYKPSIKVSSVSKLACGISINFLDVINRSIVLSAWFEDTSMTFSIVFDNQVFLIPVFVAAAAAAVL